MTAETTLAPTPEPTPLADFLAGVLKRLRPLPPLELDAMQAYGAVLAEDVRAPSGLPAFDRTSIDGYAARSEDLLGASAERPIPLSVVGDLTASSWRQVAVAPGTCYAVAAGAPMPAAADVVVPPDGPSPAGEVPTICLPGDPGQALIGFEVLARPVIRKLAGAEPVFRPSVRAHLLDTISSPLGLREFRPAHVCECRGGGYTAQPLPGGPYVLSGLASANGLLVLGERVGTATAGSTVDVLILDRRR